MAERITRKPGRKPTGQMRKNFCTKISEKNHDWLQERKANGHMMTRLVDRAINELRESWKQEGD